MNKEDTATIWETYGKLPKKINTEQCSVALGEPMRVHTTFRIGGPADLYVKPRSLGPSPKRSTG
jgi:hypothetical protein